MPASLDKTRNSTTQLQPGLPKEERESDLLKAEAELSVQLLIFSAVHQMGTAVLKIFRTLDALMEMGRRTDICQIIPNETLQEARLQGLLLSKLCTEMLRVMSEGCSVVSRRVDEFPILNTKDVASIMVSNVDFCKSILIMIGKMRIMIEFLGNMAHHRQDESMNFDSDITHYFEGSLDEISNGIEKLLEVSKSIKAPL